MSGTSPEHPEHLTLKYNRAIITATILTAAVLAPLCSTSANAAVTGSPDRRAANQTGQELAYSAKSLPALNSLEAAIAAAGACTLPAGQLSSLISSLVASPLVAKTGVSLTSTSICANVDVVANPNLTSSALTSMWAWGNPVSAADDARGQGQAAFSASTISSYAGSRNLKNVRLSVPWAADQGTAIRGWLSESVTALHAKGSSVYALGGDTAWVANPALVSQWITAAHNAAAFDGVQLDVEPWTSDSGWTTNPTSIARYVAMVKKAQATAHTLGLTLNIDAPWWLSTTPYLSGTVLSAILPSVDSVSIVAFSDHAGDTDGVIAQAWPAVVQANASLTPFTIGVQTSSDDVSGGAQYTFADKGSASLEAESSKVRAAYTTSPGYSGVTVEEYLSWISLKG